VPSALARYLLPSETCVAIVRRHWAVLIPQGTVIVITWIAWALVLDASVTPFVQTIAAFFFVFSGAWFGWLLGEWYIEQFVVTDKRILLITGLLYRKLAVMPLAKVTDLTYERSPLGRVLGYGTFVMESAGQDQALSRVEYLRSPDRLYQRLSQQLFGSGGGDDVENMGRTSKIPTFPPRPPPPPGPPPPTAPPPTAPPPPSPIPPGGSSQPVDGAENEQARRTTQLPRLP
jgi:membrane protein YdbS with pleckstrin-like domain